MKNKVYTYSALDDDFFDDGKPHELPKGYKWIKTDFFSKLKSVLVYSLAVAFGTVYCRIVLHMRIKGAKALRKCKTGFFLYGNHTQPVGDVFIPALCCFPKRIYTVVSPANFDIPVIGKILFPLGALPIPNSLKDMREFGSALEQRVNENHPVIIYPEAHVWPYYTGIRQFSAVSFKYPEKYGVPTFCMTTTYQKRKLSKKPKMTVYINGPFWGCGDNLRARAENLRDVVYDCMIKNSQTSNCEYIKYRRGPAK